MTELLAQVQLTVLVFKIHLLFSDHFLKHLIAFGTRLQGLLHILSELPSILLAKLLDDLGLDARENSQEWSLRPRERQLSSHLHVVLLNVLMQHLAVELGWRFLGQLVGQLSTLWFDDVSFSGRNAVGLRIVTLANASVNSLFVSPGRVLVFDQPLGRRLVLSLWSRHVVAIENIIDSGHWGVGTETSVSSSHHFIHNLLKFPLHFLCFLANVNISDLSLTAVVLENALDVCYRAAVRAAGRHV